MSLVIPTITMCCCCCCSAPPLQQRFRYVPDKTLHASRDRLPYDDVLATRQPLLTTADRVRHHSTGLLLPSRCSCSNPCGRRLGAGGSHHGALSGQSPVRLLHVTPARGTNTRFFYRQAAASRLGFGHSGSQERTVCACDGCCTGYNNTTSYYNNNSNHVDGEEEVDSDRTRYMEQLRRVQYGGGPTSELLLGPGLTSRPPMGAGRVRADNNSSSVGQQLLNRAVSPGLLLSTPKLRRPNNNNNNRPVGGLPVDSTETRVCARTSSVDSVKTSMHSSETSNVFPNCIV